MATFPTHKDLLVARSPFFTKALTTYTTTAPNPSIETAPWTEGHTCIVKLPDDDPHVFANHLPILYTGSVPTCQEPIKITTDGATEKGKAEADRKHKFAMAKAFRDSWNLVVRLYTFCENIQDLQTRQLLLVAMVQETNISTGDKQQHHPGPRSVTLLYNGTVDGDLVRKFLRDTGVWYGHEGWSSHVSLYPQEYLANVVAGMWEH
ncbi:hypothetical protein N0V86_000101 [Didymella sp. IMI 355093]|nr:hypothetical protein N0V86_000101 [Didymella sp. IMI 355093]